MRTKSSPIALLLGLLMLLAGIVSCSRDAGVDDGAGTILDAGQVQLLPPPSGKGAATDNLMDFTLLVRPDKSARHDQPGFRLQAYRGAVDTVTTITGRWLGQDAQPAWGFDFGPDGSEFQRPLGLTFRLNRDLLDGLDPSLLTVLLDREDGSYEVVPTQVDDESIPDMIKLDAQVEHFTRYLIGTGPPPDQGGGGN